MSTALNSAPRQLRSGLVAVLLLIAVGPPIFREINVRGTTFDTDEGHQVVAARMYTEVGRFEIHEASSDLSEPARLTPKPNWPLTYSILVAVLNQSGLSWTAALLIIRIVFLLLAAASWFWLARETIGSPVAAAAVVIPIMYRISMNPPDLFVCAISPVIIILLSRHLNATRSIDHRKVLGALAVLVALAVAMKYSAVYFIPGVIGIVTFGALRRRRGPHLKQAWIILPAVLLFVLIYTVQSPPVFVEEWKANQDSTEDAGASVGRLVSLSTTTFLVTPFKTESVMRRIIPVISERLTFLHWRVTYYLIHMLVWLALLVPLYRYYRRADRDASMRYVIEVTVLLGVTAQLLLMAIDVYRREPGFVSTYRYYAPVSAALIVIYARMIFDLLHDRKVAQYVEAAVVTLLVVPPLLTYTGREALSFLTTTDIHADRGLRFIHEATEEIRQGEPAAYMGHIKTYALSDLPVVNFKKLRDTYWDDAMTSRPTWLFLLQHPKVSADSYVEIVETLRDELDFSVVQENGWQIYYRRLEAGPIRSP